MDLDYHVRLNNSRYNAPKSALHGAYGAESYSEKTGKWVGVHIEPSPDYARIAEACGCYGIKVEDPSEVKKALRDALEQVRAGSPAVVDVRIQ